MKKLFLFSSVLSLACLIQLTIDGNIPAMAGWFVALILQLIVLKKVKI